MTEERYPYIPLYISTPSQVKYYDVSTGEETNIRSYDDAFDISEYAVPAMQYVAGAGIISGKSLGTLNPKDNAIRAEIAVIFHRFIEKTRKSDKI